MNRSDADLYTDETARAVRDAYRARIEAGASNAEATEAVIDRWRSDLSDPDVAPVFWLALADTQWSMGRLQPRVKREALQVIESGSDLVRWAEHEVLFQVRQKALSTLKERLHSPQPAPDKVRAGEGTAEDAWAIGDAFRYRLPSGADALLRVVDYHSDWRGTHPVCEVLDWRGADLPDLDEMETVDARTSSGAPHTRFRQFVLAQTPGDEFSGERIERVAQGLAVSATESRRVTFLWRYLDRLLAESFGLE